MDQLGWELPIGRREDLRGGRAQDWGADWDLGQALKEGKHLGRGKLIFGKKYVVAEMSVGWGDREEAAWLARERKEEKAALAGM